MQLLKKHSFKFKDFPLYIKKYSLFFSLFLICLIAVFSPLPAEAFWDQLLGATLAIPSLAIVAILSLLILISQGIALLGGVILDFVISPKFISISYTNPYGSNANPVIQVGLSITQSFINLALVFILIFIAFSIALKVKEYDAKKMLFRLIAIALLVNFAPVLVGLIVDASNIIMNYFLVGIHEGISGIIVQVTSWGTSFTSALSKLTTLSGQSSIIIQSAIQIFLNVAIAIAFLLFSFLFIVRYIAIWVLVILSPLAFVAWILPVTKKFWDMWWNQLIQWSIIGIPIAFFLYLGARVYEVLPNIYKNKFEMPGIEPTTVGYFNDIFPYFVIVVFLIIGFVVGLATSAAGASQVVTAGKKTGKWIGFKGLRGARTLTTKTIGASGKKWMERQASARLSRPFGEGKFRILNKAGWAVGLTPAWWAIRRGIGELGLKLTETARTEIRAAEEKYKNSIPKRKAAGLRTPGLTPSQRIGILRQTIEEGQIKDVRKLLGKNADKEIIKIGREALLTNVEEFKKIRDAFPYLAEKMAEGFADTIKEEAGLTITPKDREEGYTTVVQKLIAKIKPNFIPKMDAKSFENTEIEKAIHSFWTGNQIGTAIRELGRTFMKKFHDEAEKRGIEWYKNKNPRLATYLESSAARGLGLELNPAKKVPNYPPSEEGPSEVPPVGKPSPSPPRGRPGVSSPERPPRGRPGVSSPERPPRTR